MVDDSLQARIRRAEERIDELQGWLTERVVVERRVPLVYSSLADLYETVAVVSALQGNLARARTAFGSGAEMECSRVREARERRADLAKSYWESEPIALRDGLYAAILSRDADIREDVIELVGSMDDSYPAEFADMVPFYYYAGCLAGLVQDEDISGELTRFEESLSEFDGGLRERYAGLAEVLRGFESGEVARIEDGLSSVLSVHERELDSDVGPASRVCLSVWALRDFAWERGLEVVVGSEFVPESVGDGGE